MSYNNYVDADAAVRAAGDHGDQPTVAIIKHANPCGIAVGATIEEAYAAAHACDPVSAYGGIIATNRPVTKAMALAANDTFSEVIVAPGVRRRRAGSVAGEEEPSPAAAARRHGEVRRPHRVPGRSAAGCSCRPSTGWTPSSRATSPAATTPSRWRLVAGEAADEATLADLQFAWRAVRAVKSNAILLASGGASVGIGMGQVNRVDSCHLAVSRANADGADRARGAVAASDAFFPFADGLQVLLDAGVRAVVAPGGSVRDEEVVAAAEAAGVTMYFTGTRHFFH